MYHMYNAAVSRMTQTQSQDSNSSELEEPRFYYLDSDIIYGSINAYKYIFKAEEIDFGAILRNLVVQYGGGLINATYQELYYYYYGILKMHEDFEGYFVVYSVQYARMKKLGKGIKCLVDWVGFAPSLPEDEANYLDVFELPRRILRSFINTSLNGADFLQLLHRQSELYRKRFFEHFKDIQKYCPSLLHDKDIPTTIAPKLYQKVEPFSFDFYSQLDETLQVIRRVDKNLLYCRFEDYQFFAPIALLMANPAVRGALLDKAIDRKP